MVLRDIFHSVCAMVAVLTGYSLWLAIQGQPGSMDALVNGAILVSGIMFVWQTLRWLGPLHGTFGTPNQEYQAVRTLAQVIGRAQKDHTPLTALMVRARRGVKRHEIVQLVQREGLMLPGGNGYAVIVLPRHMLQQARTFTESLLSHVTLRGVALASEEIVRAPGRLPREEALYLLRSLQTGLFTVQERGARSHTLPVYEVTSTDISGAAPTAKQRKAARPTRELDKRKRRAA